MLFQLPNLGFMEENSGKQPAGWHKGSNVMARGFEAGSYKTTAPTLLFWTTYSGGSQVAYYGDTQQPVEKPI